MKSVFKHLKTFVFRGFLAVIPLALSYFVLKFLYVAVDQKVAAYIVQWTGWNIPGLGIVLVLLLLYLLGLVASNFLGRMVLGWIEMVSERIPLIKTIYHLGKQLAMAMSAQGKQSFKRVVMVEHFRPGVWSVGFVTGHMRDKSKGEDLLRLFIPTAPNPTAGFMVAVRESQVRELDWTVADAMNAIISGGIIGPQEIE
jgi:uncharacterized membrane protein